jgi:hypothetical protein
VTSWRTWLIDLPRIVTLSALEEFRTAADFSDAATWARAASSLRLRTLTTLEGPDKLQECLRLLRELVVETTDTREALLRLGEMSLGDTALHRRGP